MSLNSSGPEQASFLLALEPSIAGWNQRVRYVAPVRKQLFEIFEEENALAETATVKTFLRLKPSAESTSTFSVLNDTTVLTKAPKDSITCKNQISGRVVHQYSFTKVFGPDVTQRQIFLECVANQVKDLILGSNNLLFAYGTTNAGKTYTIQGVGSNPGIIPRSIDTLFKSIPGPIASIGRYKPAKVEGIVQLDPATIAEELEYKNRILQWDWDKSLEPIKAASSFSSCSSNPSRSSETDFVSNTFREMQKTLQSESAIEMPNDGDMAYSVWVSFAEVYNEYVFDLLDPITTRGRKRIPLRLGQDAEGNVFVKDLKMIHVCSGDEAFHVMLYGKANLQVASTNMNSCSSRSHCIFTIKLVRYTNCDNPSYAIVSSFSFCDLAGAERVKKTLNVGDRLKESNNINTSLHVLGRCLSTIRENQKKKESKPVPYRDSKLTRIFQRALTGHERITMFVNANTSPVLFDETVNVLKFSAIAKQIVLETPIKKPKAAVKKSRFSIMASRPNPHGTICWDRMPQDEVANSESSHSSGETNVQDLNSKNQELKMLVKQLKEEVAEEKEKNLNQERELRKNLADTFSKIIQDLDDSWKTRLKNLEERNEQLSTWRIAQLENYYKQQLESSRKRRRESDLDDSVIECGSSHKDQRIEELEEELKILEGKLSAVQELLKESEEMQKSVSKDNSVLKFELSKANMEVQNCQRQLEASQKQCQEGVPDALTAELKLMLNTEKKKNDNLRDLLNEAKLDFEMMTKDKEEVDQALVKAEEDLLLKIDELTDLSNHYEEAQLLLSQKTRALEKTEEKLHSLQKAHDECLAMMIDMSDLILNNDDPTNVVADLQIQVESLSVCDTDVEKNATDSICKSPNSKSKLAYVKLKNIIGMLKEKEQHSAKLSKKVEALEEQLKEMESLKNTQIQNVKVAEDCLKERDIKILELQSEVKLAQKDLKNILQRNIELEEQSQKLQQEMKSVLKSTTPMNVSANSQRELEVLQSKVNSQDEFVKLYKEWKDELNQVNQELREKQEDNHRLCELLKIKEAEMENFNLNRNHVIARYEEALKKAQEELEVEKREVSKLREALYKSTPTPKKSESAEIRQLKDRNEALQIELLHVRDQMSAKKPPKSARKPTKQEASSSNESLKENKEDPESKKVTVKKEIVTPASLSKKKLSESIAAPSPASSIVEPPPATDERPRRKKRLFTKGHQKSEDVEEVETEPERLPSTTPNSYLKRSLRSRKV